MSKYYGRDVDNISNVEKLDNITFSGTDTYALTKDSSAFTPSGANNILISIDGTVQQNNFSVSSSNIVFDFNVASTSACDWILHYGTGLITTPADGSVTQSKLGADAVTGAKIADDQIDSEHYVDGSIDTAHIGNDQIDSQHYAAGSIDLEHMSSESVDEDNLQISNAGTNGQFLSKQSGNTGGLTWAAAGGFLGDGQTWQDVGGSRVAGTYYTNSTGKPIQIFVVYGNVGTGADIKFYYTPDGGSEITGAALYTNSSGGRQSMTFTIPDGDQYKIYGSGAETEQQWWELR